MKPFEFRSVLALAAMALLSACGGAATDGADSQSPATTLAVNPNAPVADCEAEGCNRPRIVDGLAEQYRASAAEQQAMAATQEAPALPAQAPVSEAPAAPLPPAAAQ